VASSGLGYENVMVYGVEGRYKASDLVEVKDRELESPLRRDCVSFVHCLCFPINVKALQQADRLSKGSFHERMEKCCQLLRL
jgi:hypothetical protein